MSRSCTTERTRRKQEELSMQKEQLVEASDQGVRGESGAIGRWEAQEQRDKG